MKIIKIDRLWHGFASVRDYLIKEAIVKREDLKIVLRGTGEEMIVDWDRLFEGKKNKEKFKSKHTSLEYYLIDYLWKPNQAQRKLL